MARAEEASRGSGCVSQALQGERRVIGVDGGPAHHAAGPARAKAPGLKP